MDHCQQCGKCCRNPEWHEYACQLTEADLQHNDIKEKAIKNGEDIWIIPYVRGKCPFLVNNRCSIHKHKPEGCFNYSCVNDPHIEKGEKEKKDSKMIEAHYTKTWK